MVNVSLALLFGAILAVLLKTRSASIGGAFTATMFGFYLASTGLNEPISELTVKVVQALNSAL